MGEKRFMDKLIKFRISTEMHRRLQKAARKNSQTMVGKLREYLAKGLRQDEEQDNIAKPAISEGEAGEKKAAQ